MAGNDSGFTRGNPDAPEGTQVAFLQDTGSFSQIVVGLGAGTYEMRFDAAQRGDSQASQQDFQVLVDGIVVGTFTPTGTSYTFTRPPPSPSRPGAHDHLPGAGHGRRRQHRLD